MSVFDSISSVANPVVVDRDWTRLTVSELRRAYGTATVSNILHHPPMAPVTTSHPAAVPPAPEQSGRPVEIEAQEPSAYSAVRDARRHGEAVEVRRLPAGEIEVPPPVARESTPTMPRSGSVGRGALKSPAVLPYGFDAMRLTELIDVIIDDRSGAASLRAMREAGDLTPVDPDVAGRPSDEIVQPVRPGF